VCSRHSLGEQRLIQLRVAALEADSGSRQIQQPGSIGFDRHKSQAGLGVRLQSPDPRPARQCVVRSQIFHVEYFEAGALGRADDVRVLREFAAGEHMALQEHRRVVI